MSRGVLPYRHMPEELRCQSCGMPLDEGWFGTEAGGRVSRSYCRYCYKDGAFTKPDCTLAQAIEASVGHMTRVLRIPEPEAKSRANETIPKLARWAKES
ncbi:zinc ribbon domain-containing protein [Candidatus Uhrbacteria bacterium]|nr:zinc ribbon domain-containing protein [Candidatus Uhrbacteria bacterium]